MTVNINRRNFLRGTSTLIGGASLGSLSGTSSPAFGAAKTPENLYGPGPGIAKLNSNENPYGPSKSALQAAEMATSKGAYYVNKAVFRLVDMIAERHGLSKEQITLSAGSSGVLTWTAMSVAGKGRVLGPDLFWDTTAMACERIGGKPILHAPKTADLGIDLDKIYSMIDDDVAVVQITNPNNPTGKLLDAEKLKQFCIKASKKTLVLVDEAYNELTENPDKNSMVPLIKQGHNVIVARTFSKIYGLAGMRVGYMMGSEENISTIKKFGAGFYTLNQAGVAAAVASYNDFKFIDYCNLKIAEARDMVFSALKENGLSAPASETNFIFVNLGKIDAEQFRMAMEQQGVLIRGIYRDYTHWSRVSMGYIDDVKKYTTALPKVLDTLSAKAS